ncbi:MAG: calcium-binding protein [Pseudomonadota bacterium]
MMVLFGALALIAGMAAMELFEDDDDGAIVAAEDQDEDGVEDGGEDGVEDDATPVPDDPQDTGATFEQTSDGVEIELGEDETRSLVAMYYVDTEEGETEDGSGTIVREVDEARFYLVPGEIDWFDIDDSDLQKLELADFEKEYDMDLLGSVDLLEVPDFIDTPDERVGTIEANAPIQSFLFEAETDGDRLESIRAATSEPNFRGVLEQPVTQSTTGTDNTDWITTEENGIGISGLGGADLLESSGDNTTLLGGEGEDDLDLTGLGGLAEGGPGDDKIFVEDGTALGNEGDDQLRIASGEARGGEGDDRVSSAGTGQASLYGEAGNDTLSAFGDGTQGFGGEGNDEIRVGNGATGFGEDGNDTLRVSSGAHGFGGDGDDRFRVDHPIPNDTGAASVTGGAGADTIEVKPMYGFNSSVMDDDYLRITDFNPAEDLLELSVAEAGNRVSDFAITEESDGSGTKVVVRYELGDASVTLSLEGATGVTDANIAVLT